LTNGASGSQVLRELLALLEGSQRARCTTVVRPRLNIDSTRAVVSNDSLVSSSSAAGKSSKRSENRELHDENLSINLMRLLSSK
jgi:hypothetical protein